jgi:predicted solute-binding protein
MHAEPLLHGLRNRQDLSLVRVSPERLCREFAKGEYEAALLPVLGAIGRKRARVVPGLGVSAESATGSERLICRTHPSKVRTLAVREDAEGCADTAAVVLAELYSASVKRIDDVSEADACVVSDDAGLLGHSDSEGTFDLGDLWSKLTGLPLVLAVWSVGDATSAASLRAILSQSLQSGLDDLEGLAAEAARAREIDLEIARDYLLHRLCFRMGGPEMDSIRAMVALAKKHELCPPDAPLTFC